MILDFSKISPMARYRLMGNISSAMHGEAQQIEHSLKDWDSAPCKPREEMEGWAKAARDLARKANEIRKQ